MSATELFGLTIPTSFRPIIKFDLRAGRIFKVDRDAFGAKQNVEVPLNVRLVCDFAGFEVGWSYFSASGPIKALVPYGQPIPPQPDAVDADGKTLARASVVILLAAREIDGVREILATSPILIRAFSDVHKDFLAAPEAKSGLIPVIETKSFGPVASGNYAPVFSIVGWTERSPAFGPRTVPPPSGEHARPASASPPKAAGDLDDEIPF